MSYALTAILVDTDDIASVIGCNDRSVIDRMKARDPVAFEDDEFYEEDGEIGLETAIGVHLPVPVPVRKLQYLLKHPECRIEVSDLLRTRLSFCGILRRSWFEHPGCWRAGAEADIPVPRPISTSFSVTGVVVVMLLLFLLLNTINRGRPIRDGRDISHTVEWE